MRKLLISVLAVSMMVLPLAAQLTQTATPSVTPTATATITSSMTLTATPTATPTHTQIVQYQWGHDKSVQQIQNEGFNDATSSHRVEMTSGVTVTAPVTAVTTGGDEIANEATLAALNTLVETANELLESIDWRANTGTGYGVEVETVLKSNGAASQNVQGAHPEGATPSAYPFEIAGEKSNGQLQRVAVKDTGEVEVVHELDGTEWFFEADWSVAQTDTVVKACPAGKRIVWCYGFYTTNATQTFKFQDEDDSGVSPTIYCNGSGSGAVEPGTRGMPLWILDTDKDLEIDTTSKCDHGIRATGYIID